MILITLTTVLVSLFPASQASIEAIRTSPPTTTEASTLTSEPTTIESALANTKASTIDCRLGRGDGNVLMSQIVRFLLVIAFVSLKWLRETEWTCNRNKRPCLEFLLDCSKQVFGHTFVYMITMASTRLRSASNQCAYYMVSTIVDNILGTALLFVLLNMSLNILITKYGQLALAEFRTGDYWCKETGRFSSRRYLKQLLYWLLIVAVTKLLTLLAAECLAAFLLYPIALGISRIGSPALELWLVFLWVPSIFKIWSFWVVDGFIKRPRQAMELERPLNHSPCSPAGIHVENLPTSGVELPTQGNLITEGDDAGLQTSSALGDQTASETSNQVQLPASEPDHGSLDRPTNATTLEEPEPAKHESEQKGPVEQTDSRCVANTGNEGQQVLTEQPNSSWKTLWRSTCRLAEKRMADPYVCVICCNQCFLHHEQLHDQSSISVCQLQNAVVLTPCDHMFHEDCLRNQAQDQVASQDYIECPRPHCGHHLPICRDSDGVVQFRWQRRLSLVKSWEEMIACRRP